MGHSLIRLFVCSFAPPFAPPFARYENSFSPLALLVPLAHSAALIFQHARAYFRVDGKYGMTANGSFFQFFVISTHSAPFARY